MLNRLILMGRLVRDPELRRTQSGKAVTSFTLAVERDFKTDGGERETDFIDCVAWGTTAEIVSKYFTKGRMAVASGRLQIRGWTDNDGNKRKAAELVADSVYFGDSKRDEGRADSPRYGADDGRTAESRPYTEKDPAADFAMLEDEDTEIPF